MKDNMQVLRCDSAPDREAIEQASTAFYPSLIKFVQDGAGVYFITYTTYNAPVFVSLRPAIEAACVDYTYVAPPED